MQAPKTQRIAITVPMANNTCVLRMMDGLSSDAGAIRSTSTMPIVTATIQPKLKRRANMQLERSTLESSHASIIMERPGPSIRSEQVSTKKKPGHA